MINPNFEQITNELADNGYSICPNFVDEETVTQIRNEIKQLSALGKMQSAGVSRGDNFKVSEEVRGDKIYWLIEKELSTKQLYVYNQFQELKTYLNRTLFLGINSIEIHLAEYPAGKFYKKHIDSFQKANERKVSVILYLNEDWKESYGGQLRIYLKDGKTIEIQPNGGTLVCMLSEEMPHEVLQTNQSRYTMTGWMRRDEQL